MRRLRREFSDVTFERLNHCEIDWILFESNPVKSRFVNVLEQDREDQVERHRLMRD